MLDYTNLFSPEKYEKNVTIIHEYFSLLETETFLLLFESRKKEDGKNLLCWVQ